MKVQAMTEIELVLLRNWMADMYSAGRGFVGLTKDQLTGLRVKLEELDTELLKRVLSDDEPVAKFVDENFEATLEQVKAGKFDAKKEVK